MHPPRIDRFADALAGTLSRRAAIVRFAGAGVAAIGLAATATRSSVAASI